MYGVAYVIIPVEFASLQAALDASLAPFRRGGLEDFSRDNPCLPQVCFRTHGRAARRRPPAI